MRRLCYVPTLAVVALLAAVLAAACGGVTQASGRPANVSGTVVLKEPAGSVPASGLSVTATRQDASAASAVARTAANGAFHLRLAPGWYLVAVRYWGGPARQVHVPTMGSVHLAIAFPTEALAARQTVTVTDVPETVPPHGVWLAGGGVFLAPQGTLAPAMPYARAIAFARRYSSKTWPARAVLAVVTAPGSWAGGNPGIPGSRLKPLRDWLAWVVTFTRPRLTNVSLGGAAPLPGQPYRPPAPVLARHLNVLIDAKTGHFLLGFFTK